MRRHELLHRNQLIPPVLSLFTRFRPPLAHSFPVLSRFLRVFTASPRRFQRAPSRKQQGPRNSRQDPTRAPSIQALSAYGRINWDGDHAHEGRAGTTGGGMETDRACVVLKLAQVDRLVPFRETFALREARSCNQLVSKCGKRILGRGAAGLRGAAGRHGLCGSRASYRTIRLKCGSGAWTHRSNGCCP